MRDGVRKLPNIETIRETLVRIQRWRRDASVPAPCPLCEAADLVIIDRSARPYAEWYAVQCPACGLDDVINVPLCPQMGSGS